METSKNDAQEIVVLNARISKKHLQPLTAFFTLTAIAGTILFFVKHG